jgi:hypothetical protein
MTIKEQLIIDILKLQNPKLIENLYLAFREMINQPIYNSSTKINIIQEEEDLSVWDDIIEDTYKERRESAKLFHHKIDMLFV